MMRDTNNSFHALNLSRLSSVKYSTALVLFLSMAVRLSGALSTDLLGTVLLLYCAIGVEN